MGRLVSNPGESMSHAGCGNPTHSVSCRPRSTAWADAAYRRPHPTITSQNLRILEPGTDDLVASVYPVVRLGSIGPFAAPFEILTVGVFLAASPW